MFQTVTPIFLTLSTLAWLSYSGNHSNKTDHLKCKNNKVYCYTSNNQINTNKYGIKLNI